MNSTIPNPSEVSWGLVAESYAVAHACCLWADAISTRDYCDRSEIGERAYREYYRNWERSHGICDSIHAGLKAKEFVRCVLACAYPVPLPRDHEAWMKRWPRQSEDGCQWKRRFILRCWQGWFEKIIAPAIAEVCQGQEERANAIVDAGKALIESESKEASGLRRVEARIAELQHLGKVADAPKPLRKSQSYPSCESDNSATRGGVER
jgi:hypothetical protein